MNHSKIILVACISAFVAITTAVLGVTGTIIGSVLSSVLYNVLSEALEEPAGKAKFSTAFELDVAYVFPLVVILFIQLMLILAFLSEWGLLPSIFLRIYLFIQGVAANNLYRILGLALIVMSVYPFVLKRVAVKRTDGLIILCIGIIFLIRGFSDVGSAVSSVYDLLYDFIDFPLAVIAFILLIHVIRNILSSDKIAEKEFNKAKRIFDKKDLDDLELKRNRSKKSNINLDDLELKEVPKKKYYNQNRKRDAEYKKENIGNKRQNPRNNSQNRKINESRNGIQFESNDLLDDYKK